MPERHFAYVAFKGFYSSCIETLNLFQSSGVWTQDKGKDPFPLKGTSDVSVFLETVSFLMSLKL